MSGQTIAGFKQTPQISLTYLEEKINAKGKMQTFNVAYRPAEHTESFLCNEGLLATFSGVLTLGSVVSDNLAKLLVSTCTIV